MESHELLTPVAEEDQESLLPETIKSEVNFLIFPFFALSTKGLKHKTETEYRQVIKRGDQKLEILWNVSANPKYGYPGPFDRGVHKAIEQILSETLQKNGRVTNPIALGSLYGLCKRMGIHKHGGAQYRKIKGTLERVTATSVKSKGAFYSKEKNEWIEDMFHLYERIVFKGRYLPNGGIADTNYLFLGSWYLESLNAFYVKPLDYKYLQSLQSKIASRLYEILGVNFYGSQRRNQSCVWFEYHTLCQLLPITPQRYYSKAREKLRLAHHELTKTGLLSKVTWRKKSKTEWVIYYYPGERAKQELIGVQRTPLKPEGIADLPAPEAVTASQDVSGGFSRAAPDPELVSQLTERGISDGPARELVKKYPDRIPDKVQVFDWTKQRSPDKIKDPAPYLRRMIEEDWPAPEGFVSKEELQSKLQALKEEYQQEVKKAKLRVEEWAAQPPEERVAGHLEFWIQGQKTLKHHQPTEEEIQARREELISNLPTREEYKRQVMAQVKRDIEAKRGNLLRQRE